MNPTATRIAAAVALTIVAVTTAPGTARAADRTEVAAAFYPLAFVAQAVGGGHVDVENLTPPGVEPHDLELTPDQVDALQDASLVVAMGKGFQPAVEQVAEHRDRGTLEVLRHLKISPALRDDPHVWLDPVRMGEIVDEVRAGTRAGRSEARWRLPGQRGPTAHSARCAGRGVPLGSGDL